MKILATIVLGALLLTGCSSGVGPKTRDEDAYVKAVLKIDSRFRPSSADYLISNGDDFCDLKELDGRTMEDVVKTMRSLAEADGTGKSEQDLVASRMMLADKYLCP